METQEAQSRCLSISAEAPRPFVRATDPKRFLGAVLGPHPYRNSRRGTMPLPLCFHPSDRMKRPCLSSAVPAPRSAAYRSSPSYCICGAKSAKRQCTRGRVSTWLWLSSYAGQTISKGFSSFHQPKPSALSSYCCISHKNHGWSARCVSN